MGDWLKEQKRHDFWMMFWYSTIVSLILVVMITWMILRPYYKAKSFNRLTGQSISYWDAMWLDLRVQVAPPATRPSPTPAQ